METLVKNNGTFTVRTRTYKTNKGTVTCSIQYGIGLRKEYKIVRWSFTPTNSSVGYGNLTKKGMKYRIYK